MSLKELVSFQTKKEVKFKCILNKPQTIYVYFNSLINKLIQIQVEINNKPTNNYKNNFK